MFPQDLLKSARRYTFIHLDCRIANTFIRFFYTFVLLSFLVIRYFIDIRTMNDLAKAVNEYRYICVSFDIYYIPQTTAKSQDPNIEILEQCITEHKVFPRIQNELSHKKSNRNMAIFGTDLYVKIIQENFNLRLKISFF